MSGREAMQYARIRQNTDSYARQGIEILGHSGCKPLKAQAPTPKEANFKCPECSSPLTYRYEIGCGIWECLPCKRDRLT